MRIVNCTIIEILSYVVFFPCGHSVVIFLSGRSPLKLSNSQTIRELLLTLTIRPMDIFVNKTIPTLLVVFVALVPSQQLYGHGRRVSSPKHTFFLGKPEQAASQYFVYILSLVTDNNGYPS